MSSSEETDCVSTKSSDGVSDKSNQQPSHNKGELRLKPQVTKSNTSNLWLIKITLQT